eukprot:365317-Chlamydomonas_euryale.AAC.1
MFHQGEPARPGADGRGGEAGGADEVQRVRFVLSSWQQTRLGQPLVRPGQAGDAGRRRRGMRVSRLSLDAIMAGGDMCGDVSGHTRERPSLRVEGSG